MGFFADLTSAFDGDVDFKPTNFADSGHYNPNAFQYGGRPGQADADAGRFQSLGANAQMRQGEQVNYAGADRYARLGMQARQDQQQMAGLMAARAQGLTPSIAQMQADRQMGQAQAAQMAAANSARGPAAMALAQQGAANNIAQAQSGISGQAQINAAQERLAAEQAASGAYSGMRGQDLASQQQSAQQQQYQAQMNAAQRAQNDQYQMGMTQNELAVRQQQSQAAQAGQQILAQSHAGGQGQQAGAAQQNASTNMSLVGPVFGAAADVAGGAAGGFGGGKAAGGPVAPGVAYLVGEQGPELIVPPAAGHVLTAPQTSSLLGSLGMGGGPSSKMLDPSTGAAPTSFDKIGPGGGMNVLGSLRAHGNFGTRFVKDPTGGMGTGGR